MNNDGDDIGNKSRNNKRQDSNDGDITNMAERDDND